MNETVTTSLKSADIEEIESVSHTPVSHPLVERRNRLWEWQAMHACGLTPRRFPYDVVMRSVSWEVFVVPVAPQSQYPGYWEGSLLSNTGAMAILRIS